MKTMGDVWTQLAYFNVITVKLAIKTTHVKDHPAIKITFFRSQIALLIEILSLC